MSTPRFDLQLVTLGTRNGSVSELWGNTPVTEETEEEVRRAVQKRLDTVHPPTLELNATNRATGDAMGQTIRDETELAQFFQDSFFTEASP